MIPLWTIGLAVKGIRLAMRKHREKKAQREFEQFIASLPRGGNVDTLIHFLTLGPLAGYRTVIGWVLVLYSVAAHVFNLPFRDETLALGGGMIGIGIRFRK